MRVRDHPAAARRTTRSGTGGWHSGKIADHIGGSARLLSSSRGLRWPAGCGCWTAAGARTVAAGSRAWLSWHRGTGNPGRRGPSVLAGDSAGGRLVNGGRGRGQAAAGPRGCERDEQGRAHGCGGDPHRGGEAVEEGLAGDRGRARPGEPPVSLIWPPSARPRSEPSPVRRVKVSPATRLPMDPGTARPSAPPNWRLMVASPDATPAWPAGTRLMRRATTVGGASASPMPGIASRAPNQL